MLGSGLDMDLQNRAGETALYRASCSKRSNRAEIVSLLLDSGAAMTLQTKLGDTALTGASDRGHLDIVRLLLNKDKDLKHVGAPHALYLGRPLGHVFVFAYWV